MQRCTLAQSDSEMDVSPRAGASCFLNERAPANREDHLISSDGWFYDSPAAAAASKGANLCSVNATQP